MKRFIIFCLTCVVFVFFTACQGGKKEETVVSSGSLQAGAAGCVIVQSAQLATVAVKKGDTVLCDNAQEDEEKKCISVKASEKSPSGAFAVRVVWNVQSKKLEEKKSGLNCKPLTEPKPAEETAAKDSDGQETQAPPATGGAETQGGDQKPANTPQTQDGAGGGATPAAADAQGGNQAPPAQPQQPEPAATPGGNQPGADEQGGGSGNPNSGQPANGGGGGGEPAAS